MRSGGLSILLAAVLWGTTGTAQTLMLDPSAPLSAEPVSASPFSVGAARIVIGGLLLLLVAGLFRGPGTTRLLARGRGRVRVLLAVGAVSVVVYQLAFFVAVATTGVAVGTVVTIGSGPAFAGLMAAALGQRPSGRWLVATVGAVLGCLALVSGGEAAGVDPSGVALALLSGLGYASYATIAGHLIRSGEDDASVIAVLFGGAGLLLLPVLLLGTPGWLLTPTGMAVALYLGVVTTTVGYLLYARGLRSTSVPTATTVTMAEPVVAALLGLALLGERLAALPMAGLLIIGGSLVLLIPRRRAVVGHR
ncbi:DMT family transporter [Nocardioides limicola]|uniref:DMT family transporter n=1 Tax=Nocardioides limicola TaxID=2803368 RepID=UPI00193B4D81|nr:EamA family transporter [Nocardioides sp. DJM-14]